MAALPFQNMSGDTEQESSSRFPHPMAIRHGSYKGQAVDVKQVE
jgi:TolB-like protein